MALIKCSECGKEVSDKASACPACGNPISGAHLGCGYYKEFAGESGHKWVKILGYVAYEGNLRCERGFIVYDIHLVGRECCGISDDDAHTIFETIKHTVEDMNKDPLRQKCPRCNGGSESVVDYLTSQTLRDLKRLVS